MSTVPTKVEAGWTVAAVRVTVAPDPTRSVTDGGATPFTAVFTAPEVTVPVQVTVVASVTHCAEAGADSPVMTAMVAAPA
jgi:hypothetical protein